MRTRFLAISFILVIANIVSAQQVFDVSMANIDRLCFNPAMVGSQEKTTFFVSNRSSQNIRYTIAQAETSVPQKKLGLGIMFESYQSLLETQNSIRMNVAYRLKTDKGFWQMGLAPIVHNYRINTDNLNIRNQEDALIPSNNKNRWAMNFNAGALYKSEKLFASISVQNISKAINSLSNQYVYLIEYQHYSLFTSYTFKLANNLKIQPAIYAQHIPKIGNEATVSGKLLNDYFMLGFQYGLAQSWGVNAALFFPPNKKSYQMMLGYSFLKPANNFGGNFSHEIFLSIYLGKRSENKNESLKDLQQYRSPIYF